MQNKIFDPNTLTKNKFKHLQNAMCFDVIYQLLGHIQNTIPKDDVLFFLKNKITLEGYTLDEHYEIECLQNATEFLLSQRVLTPDSITTVYKLLSYTHKLQTTFKDYDFMLFCITLNQNKDNNFESIDKAIDFHCTFFTNFINCTKKTPVDYFIVELLSNITLLEYGFVPVILSKKNESENWHSLSKKTVREAMLQYIDKIEKIFHVKSIV